MNIRSLIFIILLAPIMVFAQNDLKIQMRNDSVFANSVFQFRAKVSTFKTGSSSIVIRSSNDSIQASLRMIPHDTLCLFIGRFPQTKLFYECKYPKIEPSVIIESYIKNKIIVNGVASKEGIMAYCKERSITVMDDEKVKEQNAKKIHERDSILAIRAKEKLDKQFDFVLKNKSENAIQIFLGDTTASKNLSKNPNVLPFRQGRYDTVNAKEEKKMIGFIDEFICITDSLHYLFDTKKLDKSMKNITINKKGKKFE